MLVHIHSAGMGASKEACDVHHPQHLLERYLQKGGHYILFPLSQSSLLHISVSLLVISVSSRGDHCSWLSGRNTAAPRHGSCPTAAFPCPHAPWICQAGVGAHGRTSLNFLFLPTHCGSQGMHCAADCASGEAQKQRRYQAATGEQAVSPASLQPGQAGKAQPRLELKHGLISQQNNPSLCGLFSQNNPLL